MAESLSSYIARLAEAHSVLPSTLINKIVGPALNKRYLTKSTVQGGSRFYQFSSAFNGVGKSAHELTTVLESLTMRHDLSNLTLALWKSVLPSKDLVRTNRAWCPCCLEEWKENKGIVYEPLLWSIKAVKVCPSHKIELQEICPGCKRKNYVLNRKSRVGFCSSCGIWLGQSLSECNNKQDDPAYLNYQVFISSNVGSLLSITDQEIKKLDVSHFENNLNYIIDSLAYGSAKGFAKKTGIPFTNIRVWRQGKNRPSLDGLLKISYLTDIKVIDLFSGKKPNFNIKGIPLGDKVEIKPDKISRRKLNPGEIRNSLTVYKNDKVPVSVSEIARSLGLDKKVLYHHFPEDCQALAARYHAETMRNKQKRLIEMESLIKEAVKHLISQGIYPSRRKVEEYTGRDGLLREKDLFIIWQKIIKV